MLGRRAVTKCQASKREKVPSLQHRALRLKAPGGRPPVSKSQLSTVARSGYSSPKSHEREEVPSEKRLIFPLPRALRPYQREKTPRLRLESDSRNVRIKNPLAHPHVGLGSGIGSFSHRLGTYSRNASYPLALSHTTLIIDPNNYQIAGVRKCQVDFGSLRPPYGAHEPGA